MTKRNENECAVKDTRTNTFAHETSKNAVQDTVQTALYVQFSDFLDEVQKRFDVEKHLKNVAFEFLLKKGLYEEFNHFLHDEPKSTCLEIILELYKKEA